MTSEEFPEARGLAPMHVLLIEDSPGDARLLQEMLADAERTRLTCAESIDAGRRVLDGEEVDLVVLDLTLPDFKGLETFLHLHAAYPAMPVVVLTGLDDQELALRAVREGAQDYLIKGRVDGALLGRVMRYALERHRTQQQLQDLNANLEQRVTERTRELKDAYDALARANDDLRELDRMKSAFITLASHELTTPLTPLLGMLDVLETRVAASPELAGLLQSPLQAARRLQQLVVRLQSIWRTGRYDRTLALNTARVEDMTREAVGQVHEFTQIRNQKLSVTTEPGLPLLLVDRDKIVDVLVNLLMNAIKFTPDGGAICLAAALVHQETVEFEVRDEGIGISEEDRPHVFDPFFSTFDVNHHSSGEYQFKKRGLGLGLTIVKQFVEMHGGAVRLVSEIDRGSTFCFTIPVLTAAPAEQGLGGPGG